MQLLEQLEHAHSIISRNLVLYVSIDRAAMKSTSSLDFNPNLYLRYTYFKMNTIINISNFGGSVIGI